MKKETNEVHSRQNNSPSSSYKDDNKNGTSTESTVVKKNKTTTSYQSQQKKEQAIPITDDTYDSNQKSSNYHFESNRRYFSICVYALCVITLGTFIVYSIVNFSQTKATIQGFLSSILPFLVAFFIAYMLNPIVTKFYLLFHEKLHVKSESTCKLLSIVLSYLLVIGALTVTLLYVLPQLGKSIADLTVTLPGMLNEVAESLQDLDSKFPRLDLGVIETQINEALPQIVSFGINLGKDLVPMLLNLSVSIVKVIINLLLALVMSVYMLNDKKTIGKNLCRVLYAFVPKQKADNFRQTASECNSIFSNFIIGKSLDSLIIGIICFVLMSILRLPYSLLLSVIVGITNMIPYFGPFIGAIPGVLLYLILSPVKSLIFALMILALQQFDGLYLGPKILGSSTGLKPLWVIFAITVGGAYGGVLGMFLGVPIVGVIAHLCNKWINGRLQQKNIDVNI